MRYCFTLGLTCWIFLVLFFVVRWFISAQTVELPASNATEIALDMMVAAIQAPSKVKTQNPALVRNATVVPIENSIEKPAQKPIAKTTATPAQKPVKVSLNHKNKKDNKKKRNKNTSKNQKASRQAITGPSGGLITPLQQTSAKIQASKPKRSPQVALRGSADKNSLSIIHAYKKGLKQAIYRHKIYPRGAIRMRITGRVVVGFELASNGQIANVKVLQTSGSKVLDKAAIKAVKAVRKYKPRPDGVGEHQTIMLIFYIK